MLHRTFLALVIYCCNTVTLTAFVVLRQKKVKCRLSVTASLSVSQTPTSQTEDAWNELADRITRCLVASDGKRDNGWDGASTGWTSWVEESSALQLQDCLDGLRLSSEATSWLRWIQASPSPMMLELSTHLRDQVNTCLGQASPSHLSKPNNSISERNQEFLQRIASRLIYLPSGSTLPINLQTPPGSLVHGKLLMGGVTRFRLLRNGKKAGERTVIGQNQPAWLQYGGPPRNYRALDMGPCLLLEVTLLPAGLEMPELDQESIMVATAIPVSPSLFLAKNKTTESTGNKSPPDGNVESNNSPVTSDLETLFVSTVGGLESQIEQIVRRVLDGRVVRSVSEIKASNTTTNTTMDQIRRQEMKSLLALGLQPVRGMLLHGPPGCGKTLLARQISTFLDARQPKVVAAPELLDRWLGGSEKLVRDLFEDAEAELASCNGDPTRSALHVVVIDEIDAVFRRRSAAHDSSEVTRASAVNQILTKLDGIQALGNVLVIGMTNRKELLDPALLRPGRLEVLVEIPLPDSHGRREILKIQFGALRERGRLSKPLCDAIDGIGHSPRFRLSSRMQWWRRRDDSARRGRIRDLAADRWTAGWSGADLAGLVRSAGSIALARTREQGGNIEDLLITLEDVSQALGEVKQN